MQDVNDGTTRTLAFHRGDGLIYWMSDVRTLAAMIGVSLKNTLVGPFIIIMPRELLENLPFGGPKEVQV